MKKRIVCVLLTLIMLMSLVPMSASAAGMSISESAITVLKQMEGYNNKCNVKGYIGYGTVCTEKGPHGGHVMSEKKSDAALREKLEELDKAVNSFASKKGISLTQSKHDAMVLFSFENGTAWTTGTGDLQAAIASGKTGSEFLNAICWWDNSTADDYRRMVEANMYLNGVYSSAKPSKFIRVEFNANGGTLNKAKYQYFDVSTDQAITFEPTQSYYNFQGWYTAADTGSRVTSVNATYNGVTLYAHWQAFSDEAMDWDMSNVSNVSYNMYAKDLASTTVYTLPNGKQTKTIATGYIKINCEFLDDNGNRWGRMVDVDDGTQIGWVMLKSVNGTTASTNNGVKMEVTVTVTNSYVNRRVNATSASAKNGSYSQGKELLIINEDDGWGQVGEYQADGSIKAVGWVCLMYTNWDSVRDQAAGTSSVTIATATITYNGYVNVRADAGTNNKIVGALPTGTTVELYETKYVNGLQWGRCKTGWLCLAYAEVKGLNEDDSKISDVGFTSYAFTGRLTDPTANLIYEAPSMNAEVVRIKDILDPNVTITHLTSAEGYTWGKFSKGWVRVTDNSNGEAVDVKLDIAKFYVTADSLTVREKPDTASRKLDSLIKGVEFNVNQSRQIMVVGETVWGYADKVGENFRSYKGWVNLANKNVSRNGAPTIEGEKDGIISGKMATVVGTNNLKVRKTGATYGAQIGTLTQGTTVAVWEEKNGWYKVDSNKNGSYDYEGDGWVSGSYLNIFDATSDSTSSNGTTDSNGTVLTGMGVVANTYSGVNVRQGAGTGYAAIGKLLPGTAVEILEVKTVGAGRWGRTAQGWVSMDYIAMVSNYEIAGTTGTAGSTASGTVTEAEDAIYTGTTKTAVTVYKETSLRSDHVRELAAGAPITLHEIRTVEVYEDTNTSDNSLGTITTTKKITSYWARINDGYIYAPAEFINLDTVDEHIYTMTGTDKLNVRNKPGTAGTEVMDKLVKGDQVTITELQIVNGNVWGKAEYEGKEGQLLFGWVSLKYMSKGAITIQNETQNNTTNNNTTTTPPVVMGNGSSTGGFVTNTSGYRYTGKVIRTNELNVRSNPSTTASKTTTLTSGQALVIYETTTAENMAWGRCDAGWVYLYYVDLTPVTGAVDARVVYNDNTIIYSDMNGSAVAGTYARMSVVDIFEIVGKMARTELGWVNVDNLL